MAGFWKNVGVGVALLLSLVALLLLLCPLFRAAPASQEDWRQAAELIRSSLRPGDLIRPEPSWVSIGWQYLGALDGVSPAPFRLLDLSEPLDPWVLAAADRVWLLAETDFAQPALAALSAAGFVQQQDQVLPGLRLALFKVPANQKLLWRGTAAFDQVELAWRSAGANPETCTVRMDGPACSSGARLHLRQRRADGAMRQCLVPVSRAVGTMVVRWKQALPAGRLRLSVANTLDSARKALPGDVLVTAQWGGKATRVLVRERGCSFEHAYLDSAIAAPLELTVSDQSGGSLRELCIDVFVRP